MQRVNKWLTIALLLMVMLEIGLRIYPGLAKPSLFELSPEFAYQLQPNQELIRAFKSIKTNELGLRCEQPKSGSKKVLKIGDSVINGGERLGNDELSSNILNAHIQETGWQVLNVSCGSWGPENQRKFLQEHPEIEMDMALVYLSSHDRFDTIGKYSPVGWSPDYPAENPPFAIWELLESFVFNTVWFPAEKMKIPEDNQGKTAVQDLFKYLRSRTDKIHVFIHPTQNELANKEMNWKGKQIIEVIEDYDISYTNNIDQMTNEMYRDDIHLNEKGHQFLAEQAHQLLLTRGWLSE